MRAGCKESKESKQSSTQRGCGSWRRSAESSALKWTAELSLPELGPTDVLVEFHAWALNYPDISSTCHLPLPVLKRTDVFQSPTGHLLGSKTTRKP